MEWCHGTITSSLYSVSTWKRVNTPGEKVHIFVRFSCINKHLFHELAHTPNPLFLDSTYLCNCNTVLNINSHTYYVVFTFLLQIYDLIILSSVDCYALAMHDKHVDSIRLHSYIIHVQHIGWDSNFTIYL